MIYKPELDPLLIDFGLMNFFSFLKIAGKVSYVTNFSTFFKKSTFTGGIEKSDVFKK
jgi:hypothetical protein